jgi:hypothetical protein
VIVGGPWMMTRCQRHLPPSLRLPQEPSSRHYDTATMILTAAPLPLMVPHHTHLEIHADIQGRRAFSSHDGSGSFDTS